MISRIIALIAISSIFTLIGAMHGHAYGSLIIGEDEVNNNQIQRYYPIASLINNQTTNKEIMIELKSQIENSDPFKIRGSHNERSVLNLSSTEGIYPNDINLNEAEIISDSDDMSSNSHDVKDNDDNECESDCIEKSESTVDDIPFVLPSIPFP